MLRSQHALQCAGDVLRRVVVAKPALLLHPPRLHVSLEVATPYPLEAETFEAVPHHLADRLGDEAPAPIRNADPVPDLTLRVGDADVARPAAHQPDAADRPPRLLEDHGVVLRRGKHPPDDLPAVLHARMDGPSGDRSHVGMARVSVQVLRITLLPGAQDQPSCLKRHPRASDLRCPCSALMARENAPPPCLAP